MATSPPGQRERAQRGEPLEGPLTREQQLAAPRAPVGPVPGAVECQSDDRPLETVFGHHARHVRVVVLHGDGGAAPAGTGVARRVDVGMQVVREQLRPRPA